ncbi:YcbK family protein [Thermocoleostomius sinensis]|jgi:hypothetical protein|uniref:D-Ala-D-Ala carboxypeptidase family metallohydrolase n=1 Tax=Thermocoleostomius sinensis A174 TaxID=2016057 RepID=A0A9E8ZC93_9CYAN|nr:D-Ala-D-Ala carboxypeptidase family metallohydrolase [Thermocoleostomius sinensis]WAL58748.1 D-Ala-D-Ala carboxypeptidase family metallohydrolase [Thermocoleostomius sinensis A174]
MVERILRITRDTVFKLRPEPTPLLAPEEIYAVMAGQTYEIQSYAYADASGDFRGHIKFALQNQSIRGLNTWFVGTLYAQVEFDGEIVYPLEDQVSMPILRVTQNTIFKQRPLQSSQLPDREKYSVSRGQSFDLQSYAHSDSRGDFSSHIRFALRNPQDFIQGRSTWYVYDRHAYVEFDGQVVYPPEDPNIFTLRVTTNTVFKRRPLQSTQLAPNEIFPVQQGTTLKLQSYAYRDAQGTFNSHIKFAIKYEKDYIERLSTWYVYDRHAQVEQRGRVVYPPRPSPSPSPSPIYTGTPIRLPGNVSTFYTDQPIIPGGNFTWGEATKDGTRIPDTVTIVNNIIALARQMQRARNELGRPFLVNSWYRPPAINDAVGGVPNSQHLFGRAADVQVIGLSGRRVANAILLWWPGGIGIYSNLPDVVHLDIGPKRTWGF